MPTGDVAVLRWLGTSNYELAYHGTILLMDTFYDRPARTASLGFTLDQFRKADVILIGHAHYDHISDVATIAAQTGAPVVGSSLSTTAAIALGVPRAQTVTVVGEATLRYGDIAIRPTHILHSTIEDGLVGALDALYKLDAAPLTPDQKAHSAEVAARGSWDPKIITEGTMGFTFTSRGGRGIGTALYLVAQVPEQRYDARTVYYKAFRNDPADLGDVVLGMSVPPDDNRALQRYVTSLFDSYQSAGGLKIISLDERFCRAGKCLLGSDNSPTISTPTTCQWRARIAWSMT